MSASGMHIAVAGGGPAGLAAAITLRARGLAPIVVADSHAMPRHNVVALSSSAVRSLHQLGVDASRHFTSTDGYGLTDFVSSIDRIEQRLAASARNEGIPVIDGVLTRSADGKPQLSGWSGAPPLIIDATGSRSGLVPLEGTGHVERYVHLQMPSMPHRPAAWGTELPPGGPFTDIFGLDDRRAGELSIFLEHSDHRADITALDAVASDAVRGVLGSDMPAPLRIASVTVRESLAATAAIDGAVLVGDSVGRISPRSQAGIELALRDGIGAADAIADGVATGALDDAIAGYAEAARAIRASMLSG